MLRDLRGVVRRAVDHDGLLPDSQEWFDKWYTPRNALLSAGPPAFRVEQCVALMRAGIVEVVGPECRFRGEETTGKFQVESPHVVDSMREATWLVEAHSPDPQLPRNTSPLYRQLREDGLVAEHLNPGAARREGPPDRRPQRHASRRTASSTRTGQVREDMFAHGMPDRAHELVHAGRQRQAGNPVGVHPRRAADRRGQPREVPRDRGAAQHDALHRRDRHGRLMAVQQDAPAAAGGVGRLIPAASSSTCSTAARSSAACTTSRLGQGQGEPFEFPVPWFLIEHPQGLVVIDGGIGAGLRRGPAQALGRRSPTRTGR